MLWRHLRPKSRQLTQHVKTRCIGRGIQSTASTTTPTHIVQLLEETSQAADARSVTVNGHVRTIRRHKKIAFAQIDDGTTLRPLQAVFTDPNLAKNLSSGVAVTFKGQWQPSQGKKDQQSHELMVEEVSYIGDHDAESDPIQNKYQTPEYLRTLPHLRPRLPLNALLLRMRSEMIKATSEYFYSQGYLQTHPPIITSSDCEGGGEVFSIAPPGESQRKSAQSDDLNRPLEGVDSTSMATDVVPQATSDLYFRSPKYLTVSTQLQLEALAQSVGKVWTLSPTFRAEKSDTARHLSEFYMLEAELTFTQDLDGVMNVVEELLRSMTQHLQQGKTGEELLTYKDLARQRSLAVGPSPQDAADDITDRAVLESRWTGILSSKKWPRITYAEAITTLQRAVNEKSVAFTFEPSFAAGLQAEHERYLASTIGKGSPIFVTDYPRDQKAFYMLPSAGSSGENDQTQTVACFDLLVPDLCEIVGGSLREHRLEELISNMQRHGMMNESADETTGSDSKQVSHSLKWYVDLRRYGSVPHGGFGLGFDRWLCYLAGVSNVRDMVAFPRWFGRCDC